MAKMKTAEKNGSNEMRKSAKKIRNGENIGVNSAMKMKGEENEKWRGESENNDAQQRRRHGEESGMKKIMKYQ